MCQWGFRNSCCLFQENQILVSDFRLDRLPGVRDDEPFNKELRLTLETTMSVSGRGQQEGDPSPLSLSD